MNAVSLMSLARLTSLIVLVFLGSQVLQAEVITEQAGPSGTPASSPRPLYLDGRWLIAFYDKGSNLKLLWPDLNETALVSKQGLPEVVNSYIGFTAVADKLYLLWRPKQASGPKTGAKYIRFRASSDQGKSFSDPVQVNSDIGAFHPQPLVSGGEGRLYLTWMDERTPNNYGVFFNRSLDAGATWLNQDVRMDSILQAIEKADDSSRNALKGTFAYNPLLVARNGRIWLGWLESLPFDNNQLKLRISKDAGTTWSDEQLLPKPETKIYAPKMLDTEKGLLVFYYNVESGILMLRSSDDGATWGKPKPLPGTDAIGGQGFDIAYNGKGSICVAWPGPNSLARKKADVFAACSQDYGSTWPTEPVRLDSDAPWRSHSLAPVIVMDDSGRTVVAWQDSRNIRSDIFVNYSLDAGKTWQKQDLRINADVGKNISRFPRIATDNNNNFLLTWIEAASDNKNRVFRLAYESFKLPENPSGQVQFAFQDRERVLTDETTAAAQEKARRERLLMQANELWTNYVEQNYASIYKRMDPFLRAEVSDLEFMAKISKLTYVNYEILEDSLSLEGNQATLKVKVTVRADNIRTQSRTISLPEIQREITDHWIWIDNDWYRLYRTMQGVNFLPI